MQIRAAIGGGEQAIELLQDAIIDYDREVAALLRDGRHPAGVLGGNSPVIDRGGECESRCGHPSPLVGRQQQ